MWMLAIHEDHVLVHRRPDVRVQLHIFDGYVVLQAGTIELVRREAPDRAVHAVLRVEQCARGQQIRVSVQSLEHRRLQRAEVGTAEVAFGNDRAQLLVVAHEHDALLRQHRGEHHVGLRGLRGLVDDDGCEVHSPERGVAACRGASRDDNPGRAQGGLLALLVLVVVIPIHRRTAIGLDLPLHATHLGPVLRFEVQGMLHQAGADVEL
mmetsp:Transcript_70203/g.203561  ORF Transcript_70203/g.203561 Transcript_70203/m.203561 type:complete len:208 (+) Transcript_70203:410-1033(+)